MKTIHFDQHAKYVPEETKTNRPANQPLTFAQQKADGYQPEKRPLTSAQKKAYADARARPYDPRLTFAQQYDK